MKKNIAKSLLLFLLMFTMLFSLTGCGSKTALTVEKFNEKAKSCEYTISDATSQFSNYSFVKEVSIAQCKTDWQVEFYQLEDEASAVSMFGTNKNNFENEKGSVSGSTIVNLKNYSTYSLTTQDKFMYLCRVDNTLLYVRVNKDYKNDVKDFIDKLGY